MAKQPVKYKDNENWLTLPMPGIFVQATEGMLKFDRAIARDAENNIRNIAEGRPTTDTFTDESLDKMLETLKDAWKNIGEKEALLKIVDEHKKGHVIVK